MTRRQSIRQRIFGLLAAGIMLFACAGAGSEVGRLLEDPLAPAPLAVLALLVETAFAASIMSTAIWRMSMVFVAMPLTQRAMFARVARRRARAGMWLLAASCSVGAGISLTSPYSLVVMLLFACVITCAAIATGTLLSFFGAAVRIAHLLWLTFGGLMWTTWRLHVVDRLGWRIGIVAGISLLIVVAGVAAVLGYFALSRRYTLDAIIAANTFRSMPEKVVLPATNEHWSSRTYALLQLVTRRLDPFDYPMRIRGAIKSVAIALAIGWLVRLVFHTNLGFAVPLIALVLTLLAALSHAPAGSNGGDWSHPLIETVPVAAREYARLHLFVNAIGSTFVVALSFVASLLVPLRVPWLVFPALLLLILLLAFVSVLLQSSAYRIDPRRTAWSRFLRSCPAAIATIAALLAAAAIVYSGFAISLTFASAAGALFTAALLAILWFWTWRVDARHQFDAEYEPSSSSRW